MGRFGYIRLGYRALYGAKIHFDLNFELQRHSTEDQIVSSLLLKWWTNFAKHGNPNGLSGDERWTPLTSDPDSKYLEISSEGGHLKKFAQFFPELRTFFEEIWAAVPPRMHLPR